MRHGKISVRMSSSSTTAGNKLDLLNRRNFLACKVSKSSCKTSTFLLLDHDDQDSGCNTFLLFNVSLTLQVVSNNSSHTAFLFVITTNTHGPLSRFRSGYKSQLGHQLSASSRNGFARTSLWSPSDCSWRKRWSLPLAFPVSDGWNSNDYSFYFGTEGRFLVGSSFEDSWKEWPENLSNKSRTRTVCSFEETRDCRSLSEELVREGLFLLAKSESGLLLQSGQYLNYSMN